jgi:AbiV family abortive infection protein
MVALLGLEASRNALALVHEADMLLAQGALARAFALSVLAAEELAKASFCNLATPYGDNPDFWPSFWGLVRGRDHAQKLRAMLFLETHLVPLTTGKHDELVEAFRRVSSENVQAMKNRALYVDLTDGSIETPKSVAEDEEAQELGRLLRGSVTAFGIIFQSIFEQALNPESEEHQAD